MYYNEKYARQSIKLGCGKWEYAVRYLYENSFKDFVSWSDLFPFFSATLQNVAYTCLYSLSPSWALNCLADLWLGKRRGTSGCIRMQKIAVTVGVCAICMCVHVCVCGGIELFWQVPHHKEGTLQRCLCWVVSLCMFTVALCFFVSAPLLLPRLARLCLAQFSLWCNTPLLQHQLFLILLLIVSLSLWPGCILTSVATLLGFFPLYYFHLHPTLSSFTNRTPGRNYQRSSFKQSIPLVCSV